MQKKFIIYRITINVFVKYSIKMLYFNVQNTQNSINESEADDWNYSGWNIENNDWEDIDFNPMVYNCIFLSHFSN